MISKPILFAGLFFFCTGLHAQIKRGTVQLGENISLSGTIDKEKTFSFNSSTYIGCFVKDNLVFGLVPGFSYSNNPFAAYQYSVSPYMRAYRNFLYPRLYLFGEALINLSLQRSKSGSPATPDVNRNKIAGIMLRPGGNFFLTKAAVVEIIFDIAAFNTHFNQATNFAGLTTKNTYSDYRFNFNLQGISVGFQFFIGKEKVF